MAFVACGAAGERIAVAVWMAVKFLAGGRRAAAGSGVVKPAACGTAGEKLAVAVWIAGNAKLLAAGRRAAAVKVIAAGRRAAARSEVVEFAACGAAGERLADTAWMAANAKLHAAGRREAARGATGERLAVGVVEVAAGERVEMEFLIHVAGS